MPEATVPAVALYTELKDFQPLIATLVALIAALIAYRGALAKVNFDRSESERRSETEKLALFLRLRAVLRSLSVDTYDKQEWLIPPPPPRYEEPPLKQTELTVADFTLLSPEEVAEAWRRLDLFDDKAIQQLEILRRTFTELQRALDQAPRDAKWLFPADATFDGFVRARTLEFGRITTASNELVHFVDEYMARRANASFGLIQHY